MYVTEADATANRICIWWRKPEVVQNVAATENVAATANNWAAFVGDRPHCIASACMQWRWRANQPRGTVIDSIPRDATTPHRPSASYHYDRATNSWIAFDPTTAPEGFCGLSNTPVGENP